MKGIYLCLCLLVMLATAADTKKAPTTTKNVMGDVFQSFLNLIPYMNNEMKFRDSKNETLIRNNLHKLTNAFEHAKHLKKINSPGFRPSYDVIVEHLKHTKETFDSGNKVFARTRLKATTQICMTCHSQLERGASRNIKKKLESVTRGSFSSDFDYADFLYLTRNFNKAEVYYRNEIRNRIEKNKRLRKIQKSKEAHFLDYTIEKSIKRLITLHTKINYNPQKAIDVMKDYKNNKNLAKKLREDIEEWEVALKEWSKNDYRGKFTSRKQVESFLTKNLRSLDVSSLSDGSEDMTLLVASGALYRYLNRYPKSDIAPELLYWISVVDQQLNFNYLYSLSGMYLKECITQYSKSPFAKKCLAKYKDDIEFGYSGSGGTFIPKEERDEIKRLESVIK
ncbi:hypothetical protein OAT67_08015 [Bacteriovoracaceae bacterium]|nr:hypothetical protein [Bacteriovoracaceae bacterium]|tara:strand:+ start:107481 stop:108662 length:1182 start_codon:yes stop_codon:yes gene_type:complete